MVGTGESIWLIHLDNEPVVHINFNEAENYCKWVKESYIKNGISCVCGLDL